MVKDRSLKDLRRGSTENYIWASEEWSKEDLINALEYRMVEPTEENIEKLHQACMGLFDDKTERNDAIDTKVCKVFSGNLNAL